MSILFAVFMVFFGGLAYKTKDPVWAMNFGFFTCAVLAELGM